MLEATTAENFFPQVFHFQIAPASGEAVLPQ